MILRFLKGLLRSIGISLIIGALPQCVSTMMFGQQHMTTFGMVSELRAGRGAFNILTSDINGDGTEDIISYSPNRIYLHLQDATGYRWSSSTIPVRNQLSSLLPASFNRDRFADLIALSDDGTLITSYIARSRGRLQPFASQRLAEPVQRAISADIDNDGRTDLIRFGEKQLGLVVHRGRNDGSFHREVQIFTEYSFNAVTVARLNDDGEPDIVASNWISNQILVYTGFGKMKYGEPVVLSLSHQPQSITLAYLNPDPIKDIVVTFADDSAITTFVSDGLGGFHQFQTIRVNHPTSIVQAGDANGDGIEDLCMFSRTRRSMTVGLNDGKGSVVEQVSFGMGILPLQFTTARHARTGLLDAIVFDTAYSTIRILHSAADSGLKRVGGAYACASESRGIIDIDINDDGAPDIMTANQGSATVSLFLNRGDGRLSGQMAFSVGSPADALTFVGKVGDRSHFLLSDDNSGRLAVLEVSSADYSHRTFDLPVKGTGRFLGAKLDSGSGHLTSYVLEWDSSSSAATLLQFRQISPTRFIERIVVDSIPAQVQSIDISDDHTQLVYATGVRGSDSCEIRIQRLPRGKGLASNPVALFSLPSPESITPFLRLADLNLDGVQDILLNIPGSGGRFTTALGNRDSIFLGPRFQREPLHGTWDGRALDLADINGDGKLDILINDPLRRNIQLFPGRGDGSFQNPIGLASTDGVTSFCISDLDNDGSLELLLGDASRGILRVLPFEENVR